MIIVFGSNVLDLFFPVADLPPHDQASFIPTHHEAPGGKGANQAVAAAKAGATVYFSGALGKGGHGRQMFDNLNNSGVDATGIRFLDDYPSGLATIFVDERDGTHRIQVSEGANLAAKQEWIPDHLLNKNSIVLVQGELPLKETEALLARAKKAGARTMMNFAPAMKNKEDGPQNLSDAILKDLDYIILNEYEADAVAQQQRLNSDDKSNFATTLHKKFNLVTIVTLGPEGSVCAHDTGLLEVSSLKIKAVDTVGAGDAFVGYLAASLDKGLSLEDSLRHAAVAGSLACTRIGAQTAVPDAQEVKSYLQQIVISPK